MRITSIFRCICATKSKKIQMSDFKSYPSETMVKIKSTGEIGEALESAFGFICVFVEDEDKCRYFELTEIEFVNKD